MTEKIAKDTGVQEYEMQFWMLGLACQAIGNIELEKMLRTVAMADSVGPILHPTMYRDNGSGRQLARQRRVLRAAVRLRDEYNAAVSEEQVEQARAAHDVAAANLSAATGEVEAAKSDYKNARRGGVSPSGDNREGNASEDEGGR